MGHDFYERSPEARAVFDQADDQFGFALSALCFDGPEDALTDTINQQPALFVTSIAAWQTMLAQGWEAAGICGRAQSGRIFGVGGGGQSFFCRWVEIGAAAWRVNEAGG